MSDPLALGEEDGPDGEVVDEEGKGVVGSADVLVVGGASLPLVHAPRAMPTTAASPAAYGWCA